MNTAELTALHTATLTAINEEARTSRTLASITARAETLFNDGYTVERSRVRGLFYITGPQGQEYQVNVGTAIGTCCDCPAFAKYDTCKHYEAVELMLREEAQGEAADRDGEADEARAEWRAERQEMALLASWGRQIAA